MLGVGFRAAIVVGVLAVVLPTTLRILLSPWTLLLVVLPTLLTLVGVSCLFAVIGAGFCLDKRRPRRRDGLLHAIRPLAFSTPAAWEAVQTRAGWSAKASQTLPPIRPNFPIVSSAVDEIIKMMVRDFIKVWYSDISQAPSFPSAVSDSLHYSLDALLKRVESLDLSALIVRRILPKLTVHVDQFRYSETTLRGAGLERHLTQSEELDLLLASRYVGKGYALHPAIDNLSTTFTKQTEEAHLRRLVDAALPFILPPSDANSKAAVIVIREIVASVVLAPVTDMLSDPDFWNRTIEQLASAAIRQQKLISKVRSVLEIQSTPRSHSKDSNRHQHDVITLDTDPRHFEGFLRSISRYNSLLDARRLKNDILGEIRRTRTLLASHENEDWINGHKTEDVVAFLDRLYTAKRKIEKRIVILGGQDESISIHSQDEQNANFSLRDVLTNPSSLSHFMEFMDRRGRSLLVQFWLTVESFKNPLEDAESTSSEAEESVALPSGGENLQEDLRMINDLYFSHAMVPPALSIISRKYVNSIRLYAANPAPAVDEERKARRCVIRAQRQVEQDMDHDLGEFRKSDLWFRAVGDLEARTTRGDVELPSPPPLKPSQNLSASGLLSSLLQSIPSSSASPSESRARPRSNSSHAARQSSKLKHPSEPIRAQTAYPTPIGSRTVSSQGPLNSSSLQVLMSPSADSDSGPSRAPLFDESEDPLFSVEAEEAERMEAIHAAVTDIIAAENRLDVDGMSGEKTHSDESLNSSLLSERKVTPLLKGIESDGQGYSKESLSQADGNIDDGVEEEDLLRSFNPAGPGDLQLSSEITRLGEKIEHLQSQDMILDTLIQKAELTGDTQELKLLRRSKSALVRELRQLSFQKSQFEQQNFANKLIPGRTNASIVNAITGEEDGKSVVRYLIEVQQLASDGSFASGWVVARRYSEFLNMHQRLRERYVPVKNLDFPGKRLVNALSAASNDSRKIALEKYLQNLLLIPMVCESQELRSFLSRDSPFMTQNVSTSSTSSNDVRAFPGHKIVQSVVRTFTDSIDDMFFGTSMLDVMIGRLTRQAAEFAGIVGPASSDEDLVTQALRASGSSLPEETLLHLPGDLKPLEGESSTSSFTAPICDFILSVFELDKKNNWLRRQAIVIILQQVLGDTVEKKVRESMKAYLDEPHLMQFIDIFKDGLWPGGQLKPPQPPRSVDEKARTKDEANRKLSALLPDMAANIMGRSNARRGARRIFAVLQNKRLNQHIVYTVLDEIFMALFPEVHKPTV